MKSFLSPKALLLLCFTFLFLGCAALSKYGQLESQAQEHFEQKQFDQAFYKCERSLSIEPDYEDSQGLINKAYDSALAQHHKSISELKNSDSLLKYDLLVNHYKALNKLNNSAQSLSELMREKSNFKPQFSYAQYDKELEDATQNAAEAHYQEGLRLSELSQVEDQKEAAKEFKKALEFKPNFKDAQELYQQARKLGTTRIVVIPFENKSRNRRYGAIEEVITDDLISNLLNSKSSMEFTEIISRDELTQIMNEQKLQLSGLVDDESIIEHGKILGVNEILVGSITQINYSPIQVQTKSFVESKNVKVGEVEKKDDLGRSIKTSIMEDVEAKVTQKTHKSQALVSASFKLIDVSTSKIKFSQSFKEVQVFQYSSASFKGDSKALSKSSKRLVSAQAPITPTPVELVNKACKKLSNQITSALIGYIQ